MFNIFSVCYFPFRFLRFLRYLSWNVNVCLLSACVKVYKQFEKFSNHFNRNSIALHRSTTTTTRNMLKTKVEATVTVTFVTTASLIPKRQTLLATISVANAKKQLVFPLCLSTKLSQNLFPPLSLCVRMCVCVQVLNLFFFYSFYLLFKNVCMPVS